MVFVLFVENFVWGNSLKLKAKSIKQKLNTQLNEDLTAKSAKFTQSCAKFFCRNWDFWDLRDGHDIL